MEVEEEKVREILRKFEYDYVKSLIYVKKLEETLRSEMIGKALNLKLCAIWLKLNLHKTKT